MQVYKDKVTGIEHLFITIGIWGIFSGVYDPAASGSIRWETVSELGLTTPRPLALIEANGSLLFSAGKRIYQRTDGPSPRWNMIVDESDLLTGIVVVNAAAGGIRGLTAIPAPNGAGDFLRSSCGYPVPVPTRAWSCGSIQTVKEDINKSVKHLPPCFSAPTLAQR